MFTCTFQVDYTATTDLTLSTTINQIARKILRAPGKYTSCRHVRMAYSYCRRPPTHMVAAAFRELEENRLGKHYAELGFVKTANPDTRDLSIYDMTLVQYMEKYTKVLDNKIPYGLTPRKAEMLDSLIKGE